MKPFLELRHDQHLLTPEFAVLRPHGNVDTIVLGSTLRKRLLQGLRIQHETVIEAAGDVVHLQEVSCALEQWFVQYTGF